MTDNGADIWLKLDSTAEAITVLKTLGVTEFISRDSDDKDMIVDVFNHDVAILFHSNILTKRATYDRDGVELTPPEFGGPHMMIRLVSDAVKTKSRNKLYEDDLDGNGNLVRKTMPAGIEIVDSPGTVVWA